MKATRTQLTNYLEPRQPHNFSNKCCTHEMLHVTSTSSSSCLPSDPLMMMLQFNTILAAKALQKLKTTLCVLHIFPPTTLMLDIMNFETGMVNNSSNFLMSCMQDILSLENLLLFINKMFKMSTMELKASERSKRQSF